MTPDHGNTVQEATANPSGYYTFLLTDIEASSELWEAQPSSMRRALARHDQLLAHGIAAHGGRLIKSRGEGDSAFAVFLRAADAVAAACSLQQVLLAEPWPTSRPLRVRMAMHTGEADQRDGDFYGVTVNRCARLRDLASGGQVVLSQATQELVEWTLPASAGVRPLGVYALRGSSRPEPIFQLTHPDLPAQFPPLNARVAQCSNLPAPVSSFVGREWELGEVTTLLSSTRLLTLTGSGGSGKTRLALQVAGMVLEGQTTPPALHAPDGVWLVELAALPRHSANGADLVLQAIAGVFGVWETGQSLLQDVVAFLQLRGLLIVLDNCEHLVSQCATLASQLLAACPGLRILATSQEALGVEGEKVWRVLPLSLPDGPDLPPLARLAQFEAIRLFMERARAQRPGLALTQANAPTVVRICRQLDGIPLALELAAARVGVLSIETLASRLDDRFEILSVGNRGASERHQTLRAAMEWSYDLLSVAERTLLRRLSVFQGGWSLDAAEAVCADQAATEMSIMPGDRHLHRQGAGKHPGPNGRSRPDAVPASAVLILLAQLVAKSLVIVTALDEHLRYGLLETVRHYAGEQLTSEEAEALRSRYCAYYLQLVEEAEAGLTGAQQATWLARLEHDHDNLRAALAWCIESGDGVAGVQLAAALCRFWEARGHLSEGRRWMESALDAGQSAPPALRARTYNGAGTLARKQGDFPAASALHRQSLALYRELGHRQGIAASLNHLGLAAEGAGDFSTAATWYEEALSIRRSLKDRRGTAFLLNNLGNLAQSRGDLVQAAGRYEESLAIARPLGDHPLVATQLANLGNVARGRRDLNRALSLLHESLTLFRQLEDAWGIGLALYSLGLTHHAQAQFRQAEAALREALDLHRDLGDKQCIAQDLEALAATAALRGLAAHAAHLWGAAQRLRQDLGAPLDPADLAAQDALLASLRDSLGSHACSEALTIGRAWSLDQAIAAASAEASLPG